MTARGHMTLASALTFPVVSYLAQNGYSFDEVAITYAVIIFFSIFPDIDEPRSKIGRMLLPLSILLVGISFVLKTVFSTLFPQWKKNIKLALSHRGITHYAIFSMGFGIVALFTTGIIQLFFIAATLGNLFHVAGDMLTKGGVKNFFFPFFLGTTTALLPRSLRFYTDSVQEYLFVAALLFINIILYAVFLPALIIG